MTSGGREGGRDCDIGGRGPTACVYMPMHL